ncbi:uncharacterized protein IL334_007245 [Kwoniella shivajii]|uniref:Protein AF-9 homolog n=1 Tax=Kwoniella shivajii TaxID=564305 RepID=A0ABZ1DA98_9TREE|nr:hypothetical protein IL334_007245 [Kwoniella shivajii]
MSGSERIKGIQVHRPIIYGSHARLLTDEEKATAPPGHTHRWTVFLTSATSTPPTKLPSGELQKESIDYLPGGADDLSYLIKKVTFKLHETYTSPNRVFDKPPFAVTETGWGEFVVQIRIQFIAESSEKPLTLNHPIKLHHWGIPVEGIPANTETGAEAGARGESTAPNSNVATPVAENQSEPASSIPQTSAEQDKTDTKKEQKGEVKEEEISTPIPNPDGKAEPDLPSNDLQSNTQGDQVESTQELDQEQQDHSQIIVDSQRHPAISSITSSLPVHSWQYDELIFSDPSKIFLDILNENPPTPLPNKNRRPRNQREEYDSDMNTNNKKKGNGSNKKSRQSVQSVQNSRAGTATEFGTPAPTNTNNGLTIAQFGIPGENGSADVPLEFSLDMEKGEWNTLADARKKIVEQMDKWRERLIAQEKELNRLKDEVKAM